MNDKVERSKSSRPENDAKTPPVRKLRFGRVETYPDSPIVIPPDRRELSRALLVATNELWIQGQHLEALISWYSSPEELRSDVVSSVLLDEAKPHRSLRDAQFETEGHPENFVLQHYALVTNPAVRKMFQPVEDEPITEDNWHKIKSNPGDNNEFRRAISRLGIRDGSYDFFDYADFTNANAEIVANFSLDEAREFLINLIPNLSDEVKNKMLSTWGVVHSVKWADLLTDPRLADDLERAILYDHISWADHLEQFLAQDFLPSVEFFEEAFRRLKDEDSDPNSDFSVSVVSPQDTTIPSSLLYFSMLRRTIPSEMDGSATETREERMERITSYLLSDEFMRHALPYLSTEELYPDVFVVPKRMNLTHNATIEDTGDDAKTSKRKRLGEVIQIAIDYARKKGDDETVKKLTDKEVDGVRLTDFISS
ncbi:MAG: hypothetical protein AAB532_03320 [Patescibacteria group bacterium]